MLGSAKRTSQTYPKFAYQVVLRLAQQQSGESSNNRSNEKIWKHIWTLNVPLKVRNFSVASMLKHIAHQREFAKEEGSSEFSV